MFQIHYQRYMSAPSPLIKMPVFPCMFILTWYIYQAEEHAAFKTQYPFHKTL